MPHKLAILDDYQNVALDVTDWSVLGDRVEITVFDTYLGDEDNVAASLEGFDIVVAMRERTPFPATLLRRLKKLRLLVTTGKRNLAFDMQAARDAGIDVCGTAMLGYAAAEHAWSLVLALAKQIPAADQAMRTGGWQAGMAEGLNGKTLGVLGLGKLGERMAEYAMTFEMDVIAWSQNLTAERADECGVRRVEKEEFFTSADYITVQLVLSERTRGLVGAHELGLMKPSAYLINTSRGPIVDEAALIEALQQRRIAGAGLDVYDVEPLPPEHPLRQLDNTVLTGHIGYVIRENYALSYGEAVEDVAAWLDGQPLRLLN
jgi:phosphoglycerate dehydrogenase-like enzyme